jgi:hypothetical protein
MRDDAASIWGRSGSEAAPSTDVTVAPPSSSTGTLIELGLRAHPGESGTFGAGTVTGTALLTAPRPDVDAPPANASPTPAAHRRRIMMLFGGGAGAILAAAVAVVLALTLTGHSPIHRAVAGPPDTRAPLAKLCPPPSNPPAPLGAVPATPPGPRIVDQSSGISYGAYGPPWRTWNKNWDDAGELHVAYRTGQYFVTEEYQFGEYLATILSASVPAATNDALTLDLKCTGTQVAADVRSSYYPTPNTMEPIRNQATTLGGRPAWLDEFRLHFHEPGLRATDELVAIAVIDVGRPSAAILYISIPGTHRQYDYVIDQLLDSVRPAG